jgi:hypothetical protein
MPDTGGLHTKSNYTGVVGIDPVDVALLFTPGPGEVRIGTKIAVEVARQYALMLHDLSRDLGPSRRVQASTLGPASRDGTWPGETISRGG